jgi:ribonuclease HIII
MHDSIIVNIFGCDTVIDASILNLQPFKVNYLSILSFQNINCMQTLLYSPAISNIWEQ